MSETDSEWWERAMRWGQINIREIEPPEFDVNWWESWWDEIALDGITLNAGGVWAYYPTRLEDQRRSRWLGDRDLFGELVDAAKRCDMRVLARIDPSLSHEEVYYRHPDWFALDRNGEVRTEPRSPGMDQELYVTCMNGPYYREHVPEVIEEIHSLYDVDGIFGSEWDGRRLVCYCPRCRELFEEATGLELPEEPDPSDMAWKRWFRWHEGRLADLWQYWDGHIEELDPDNFWMGNHSDKGFLADHASMINVDQQSRSGHDPLWIVGEQGKKMRAITRGEKSYYHIFSSNYRSRHMTKPEAECRLYVADAVLSDSRPWFTIIGGVQKDGRQFEAIRDMYRWHAENEEYLRGRNSAADVAVAFYDREDFINDEGFDARSSSRSIGTAFRGVYYALLRDRIPFDLVHAGRMDEEAMEPYDVLVLPDVGALSESEGEDVRRFVGRGGGLVATYETGVYDEWGEPRDEGAIDDVLGVERRWPSVGPLDHSYVSFESSDPSHPVLGGMENTERTLFGDYLSPVEPASGVDASRLSLVPPYPAYPPETAFSRTGEVERPLLLINEGRNGSGNVIYWPWDVCRFYWESNSPDHGSMLTDSVRWARPGGPSVRVEGPGLVEVHPYEGRTGLQVHMVNLTNPDVWKAPVRELTPVGTQEIGVELPDGAGAVENARCLVSGRSLPVETNDGWAEAELPGIEDHEVVVFEHGG